MAKIDQVDKLLSKMDGRIERKPDPMLCRHGPKQKCVNCLSLDPYDANYLTSKGIKHMSFHAYVRKLTELHGRGTRSKNVLETENYRLNTKCTRHRPYPEGICTDCRPSTVTLKRQPFRHIDNIEFENDGIVNEFLNFWRRSLHQRIGYLIGRHEHFSEVPLGIKTVVCAIWEPPQHSTESSVGIEGKTLGNEEGAEAVDELCEFLGLRRVGWMFTDLWGDNRTKGMVHCIRNEDSFLLSASECITAGSFQSKFKNFTEYCDEGSFGSKFVTVVASGNNMKGIDLHGYQVSNQCTAMVDAEILCPTKTHPELAWVREKPLNEKHYITAVQYTEKDEHGADVMRDGRPLPVEYLLVDVPCGVRKVPNYTFIPPPLIPKGFPIENREAIEQTQGMEDVAKYMSSFKLPDEFLKMASDFHFLLFLRTNHFVEFSKEEIKELAEIVQRKDEKAAKKWATDNATMATLKLVAEFGRRSNGTIQSTSTTT